MGEGAGMADLHRRIARRWLLLVAGMVAGLSYALWIAQGGM